MLEGFGRSVSHPSRERDYSFPRSFDSSQSCHLIGSLALILHLPGLALLPTGPYATPTAVPLHLEPGGSVGTTPGGLELTAVFLAFSEKAADLRF